MGQCSLPLDDSNQPLVFQVTRVFSSFEGLAWGAVACAAEDGRASSDSAGHANLARGDSAILSEADTSQRLAIGGNVVRA